MATIAAHLLPIRLTSASAKWGHPSVPQVGATQRVCIDEERRVDFDQRGPKYTAEAVWTARIVLLASAVRNKYQSHKTLMWFRT